MDRVEKAMEEKRFTHDDVVQSRLWVTDPVSEFPGAVEFRGGDLARGPVDIYLVLDGIFFTKGVEDGDLNLAFQCFRSICRRVAKLSPGHALATSYCREAEEMCRRIEKK